jgi:predicted dehydrogenase
LFQLRQEANHLIDTDGNLTADHRADDRHDEERRVTARRRRTRLAVVGLGDLGRVHARNVAERIGTAELAWVVDREPEVARRVAGQLDVAWTDSLERVLADETVHGVVIATSTASHPKLIEQAAGAGKHVFTEKPIGLELATTVAAIDAAKSADVILQVGFHRRFDADFRAAADRIKRGDLGALYFLRIAHRDKLAPAPGTYLETNGPLVVDSMIHDFDSARWLVGEVVEISAHAASVVDPRFAETGDADHAAAVVRFDTGALGIIDNSRQAGYGYECTAEILGSAAGARIFQDGAGDLAWLSEGARVVEFPPDHLARHRAAYVAELEAFAEAIRDGQPSPVPGEEGLAAFRVSLAALTSLQDRRPVHVSTNTSAQLTA